MTTTIVKLSLRPHHSLNILPYRHLGREELFIDWGPPGTHFFELQN